MGMGTGRRLGRGFSFLGGTLVLLLASVGIAMQAGATMGSTGRSGARLASTVSSVSFHYGYDLTVQEPDTLGRAPSALSGSVSSARNVMSQVTGTYVDQSIDGFGADVDPEPSPGVYNMSGIAERLAMIESSGNTPVISLVGAPPWMRPGTRTFFTAPAPQYYQAFATLCAFVAKSFPEVKYFVVWNELKGFWDPETNTWNIAGYTEMYNDVYKAIKKVRPTAQVGGPYVSMTALPSKVGSLSALHGTYGYVSRSSLNAMTYWLANNVGANFVAVDGATENAKAGVQVTDPVTAATMYAAVDHWLEAQTDLPIWWMESHIAPTGWSTAEGSAARIATLAEMAGSGASVGMQWQPQEESGWPDEGLWTSTLAVGGGQATPLAKALIQALPVLEHQPSLEANEPAGVLVATDAAGTLAVNTTSAPATATVAGTKRTLEPDQVLVN